MITRKIVWVPSINNKFNSEIQALEARLKSFYSSRPDYYNMIDFTGDSWKNQAESGYHDIIESALNANRILEVGCGKANILSHKTDLSFKYTGCDFSESLMNVNSEKYPQARFDVLEEPNLLPYQDGSFNLVFSVFVIEHSCNPAKYLNECFRVLARGGILIILCPDFLSRGRMSSQRAGYSEGTTRDKLKRKEMQDAVVTYFDNKIKIPFYSKIISYGVAKTPRFYINLQPTVFTDRFIPDVDAVYLTHKGEMTTFLSEKMTCIPNTLELARYEKERKLIYLKLEKN